MAPPANRAKRLPSWMAQVRRAQYRVRTILGTSWPTQTFQAGPAASPAPQ